MSKTVQLNFLRTLEGDESVVMSFAISPCGKLVAGGVWDGVIYIWDLQTGNRLHTLQKHNSPVRTVLISPDGQTLISCGDDSRIKIWNPYTGECIRTIYRQVSYEEWDEELDEEPEPKVISEGHSTSVFSIAISSDSKTLISGSYDRTVKIWELATGNCIRTIQHKNPVAAVAISPSNSFWVSGDIEGTINFWNILSSECDFTIKTDDRVSSLAISKDNQTLASMHSFSHKIRIWNASTGENTVTLQGHNDLIQSIVFSPDGQTLISSSCDKTIKFWDVFSGDCLYTQKERNTMKALCISYQGDTLVSCCSLAIGVCSNSVWQLNI